MRNACCVLDFIHLLFCFRVFYVETVFVSTCLSLLNLPTFVNFTWKYTLWLAYCSRAKKTWNFLSGRFVDAIAMLFTSFNPMNVPRGTYGQRWASTFSAPYSLVWDVLNSGPVYRINGSQHQCFECVVRAICRCIHNVFFIFSGLWAFHVGNMLNRGGCRPEILFLIVLRGTSSK